MLRATLHHAPLLFGVFLLLTANGLLATLLSVRATDLGYSGAVVGAIQACYPLGALLGCMVAPKLVERVGHIRAFGALASLCSIAAVAHLLTSDAWSWGAMRLLAGLCFPGLYVVSESWLNASAHNAIRASLLSSYFIAQMAGTGLGQAMLLIPDPSGDLLFGLASILISLALAPVLISAGDAPSFTAPERLSVRALFAISPMAVIGAWLSGVAQAVFFVATPLVGLALGLSAGQAGLLLTAGTLGGVALQFPIGWLSDRTDRRKVAAVIALGATISASAAASGAIPPGPGFVLCFALIGGLILPIYALCVAHANDQLRPSQIVPASGALVLVLNMGLLLGAFAGPAVIELGGAYAPLWLLAGLAAATATVALLRAAQTRPPEGGGVAQAVSPQATQVAARLNPEATPR